MKAEGNDETVKAETNRRDDRRSKVDVVEAEIGETFDGRADETSTADDASSDESRSEADRRECEKRRRDGHAAVQDGEDAAVQDGEDAAVQDGEDAAVQDGEDAAVQDGEDAAVQDFGPRAAAPVLDRENVEPESESGEFVETENESRKARPAPLELVHADGRGATEPRAVPSRRRRLEDDGGLGA